jgi:hypothetical protein
VRRHRWVFVFDFDYVKETAEEEAGNLLAQPGWRTLGDRDMTRRVDLMVGHPKRFHNGLQTSDIDLQLVGEWGTTAPLIRASASAISAARPQTTCTACRVGDAITA